MTKRDPKKKKNKLGGKKNTYKWITMRQKGEYAGKITSVRNAKQTKETKKDKLKLSKSP